MAILNFFKKFKREIRQTWIPWAKSLEPLPVFDASSIPSVRKAIGLYSSLLTNTPLVTADGGDAPILKVLENPSRILSRCEWLGRAVENYFTFGNTLAFINKEDGEIKSLPLFNPQTIFQYSQTNDPSNPLELERPGSTYYRSQYEDAQTGRKTETNFLPEYVFHVKNPWGAPPDFLNGLPLSQVVQDTLAMSSDVMDTAAKFSRTGFLQAQMVSGVAEMEGPERAELRQEMDTFIQSKGTFLTVDDQIKMHPLTQNNVGVLLQVVSSLSTGNWAKIFNIPVQLLSKEDQTNSSGAQEIKELHRFWIRTAGAHFLKIWAEAFSRLGGVPLKYDNRANLMSDLRELQTLPALIEAGILNKTEAQAFVRG